jgi:hypothetical protein
MSFLAGLTSLGQVANEAGDAGNEVRQEKEQRADKTRQLDAQDAYLQLAKQADTRQAESQKQALATGDLMKVGNRLWSVSKAKFVDAPTPDPMESLKRFVTTLPKEQQPGAQARAQAALEADPGDPKAAIAEVMRYADAQQAETNRRQDAATTEQHRREDASTRGQERRDDKQESERANERLQKMMVDFRLQEKQQYMTPQERQVYDTIKQVEPSVNRTIDFLENTKDSGGKPLAEENDLVFGNRSALMNHLRMRGYKFGQKQDDISQQLIKNAALIQVLGARPWMTMGRGKFIYETIAQHLPAPTDTPANMHDKLVWLRDNVLTDAKDSLAGYVQPGGAGGGGGAAQGQGTQDNPIVIP